MSDTSLLHFLSKFCCCKDNGTDREQLVNRGAIVEDGYHIPNGNGSGAVADYITNNLRPFANDRNMNLAPELQTVRSREEEEEELMNRILDRTQQSIIDVTNLENNSLDIDMIQRSRLYLEAVKRHDTLLERKKAPPTNTTDNSSFDAHRVSPLSGLFSNIGNNSTKALLDSSQCTPCNQEELSLLNRATELFMEAHNLGTQIECKEELIVYMSLDDDD
ncbi:hypothetical protein Mgra_00002186 [Meloidogyne graminicola]|uniref:Late endosomal/lysosomal adaptor and MAPK and MTOR activator 1 n=1 Tax=Meloidogyne graminicola TaxID=189291 RepID=A0A8S9ZZ15_9BILA|nr:hypothetical protein Mgra_00002186 [Meloidogyne graminicola]